MTFAKEIGPPRPDELVGKVMGGNLARLMNVENEPLARRAAGTEVSKPTEWRS